MFSADSVSDQIKQSYILPNQLSKRFYTVQVCFAVDFLWSLLFNFLMDAIQIPIIAEETTLEDLEKIPTVDALTKYCKETWAGRLSDLIKYNLAQFSQKKEKIAPVKNQAQAKLDLKLT